MSVEDFSADFLGFWFSFSAVLTDGLKGDSSWAWGGADSSAGARSSRSIITAKTIDLKSTGPRQANLCLRAVRHDKF